VPRGYGPGECNCSHFLQQIVAGTTPASSLICMSKLHASRYEVEDLIQMARL